MHTNDHNRSVSLAEITRWLPSGVQYISLQKEVRDTDKPALQSSPDILHLGEELKDFADTIALCGLMDIVISVDTCVAHLCGAIGKPCWLLLPFVPDWRWMLDRDDSPWYSSLKLYRQQAIGDWYSVFTDLSYDLRMLNSDCHTNS
jgi:hypothetical protein